MRRSPLVALILGLFAPAILFAQGIVIDEVPQPPPSEPPTPAWQGGVHLRSHAVEVAIRQGVSETTVEQVFHNPLPQALEGTYLFPLPDTAAISKFSMFMDGKEIQGEVLEANKAREIYESIVRQRRDPGILEYVGRRLIRARVFPIPAQGDVKIRLAYAQELESESGLVVYDYAMNSAKLSRHPVESIQVKITLESDIPIRSVYSPTHPVEVVRDGERKAQVQYSGGSIVPDSDFRLYYQLSKKDFGLALLTHRNEAHRSEGEDGYFLVLISPKEEYAESEIAAKDLTLVVDTSGSMLGAKMEQARKALLHCLGQLRPIDRFQIVRFSTEVEPFAEGGFREANEANLAAARGFVEGLEARGGTNISGSLDRALEAKSAADRLHLVIFITDGKPTIGERDTDRILAGIRSKNAGAARLFVFGVGDELNAVLLDKIAEENRGTRSYVGEKDDLEARIAAFYEKVASPVLSDLELAIEGVRIRDLYPKKLPDLFKGTQLVLFGRYEASAGAEPATPIRLSGKIGNAPREFAFEGTFPAAEAGNEYLPRLWARRKVAYLMDEIRLHGESEELKEEIVRLGKQHGIVTPYTSFLVLEDGMEIPSDPSRIPLGEPNATPGQPSLGAVIPGSGGGDGEAGGFAGKAGDAPDAATGEAQPMEEARRAEFERFYRSMGGRGAKDKAEGKEAIEHSKKLEELKQTDALEDLDEKRAGIDAVVKKVGAKTFYFREGAWVDSEHDPAKLLEEVSIEYLSAEYFTLVEATPELAKYLAVGEAVVIVHEGKVYRVTVPKTPESPPATENKEGKE